MKRFVKSPQLSKKIKEVIRNLFNEKKGAVSKISLGEFDFLFGSPSVVFNEFIVIIVPIFEKSIF